MVRLPVLLNASSFSIDAFARCAPSHLERTVVWLHAPACAKRQHKPDCSDVTRTMESEHCKAEEGLRHGNG